MNVFQLAIFQYNLKCLRSLGINKTADFLQNCVRILPLQNFQLNITICDALTFILSLHWILRHCDWLKTVNLQEQHDYSG
jgi:hypothetical protein